MGLAGKKLEKLHARIRALSTREKVITALTLALVVLVLPYITLYSPSAQRLKTARESYDKLGGDVKGLEDMARELSMGAPTPPPERPVLPMPDDLQAMFKSISTEANTLGVDFISITPTRVDYKNGLIDMGLSLRLRARYRQVFDFARYLAARHKLFIVNSVRFETNEAVYPSGVALINARIFLRNRK